MNFLFKQIDARQFASLRIIFGALAFLTLWGLVGESSYFYSDEGWFPLKLAVEITNKKEWTLLHTITSAFGVKVFFLIAMIAALFQTVGFYSRVTSWITFVCIVSIHSRNWLNTYGGDAVLRMMLFYVAISPSGLAWSVDSLLKRFREGSEKLEEGASAPRFNAPARTVLTPIWPLRLMQFQVCLIYFTTGLAKLHGRDWVNGTALGTVLMNPVFVRFDFSWIQSNPIAAMFLRFMSWITLAWEIFFPLLVVAHRYSRWLALAIGVGVHGGIIMLLQIHWFGYLMIGTYFCFLPNRLFRTVEVLTRRRVRQTLVKSRMRVIYDGQCEFCKRAVLLLSLLDVFRRVELIPSREEPRWRKHAPQLQRRELELALYATSGKGAKPVPGMDAFCELGRVVPALLPLRWIAAIPGVKPLGRRAYAWISARRYCLIENRAP